MWFTYRQNNSGGYTYNNDDVGDFVSIQANTAGEADLLAEDIFEQYSDYCPCCGERWYIYSSDSDGAEEPSYYGAKIEEMRKGHYSEDAVLYFMDSSKKRIIFT